jgi:small ligand-binding sensory domain FIST
MTQAHYAKAPSLGVLYITDHYAAQAQEVLDQLSAELPWVSDWVGSVGVGIASNNVEYFDEPALAVMLCDVASDQYRVFSGVSPWSQLEMSGFEAHTALIHADAKMPDLGELIQELAARTHSGYVFGGLSSSRSQQVQFAMSGQGNIQGQGQVRGVFSGGLSGVAFGEGVALVSRVTQGCMPLGPTHHITAFDQNLILELDHEPALSVMQRELGVSMDNLKGLIDRLRQTLVGLSEQAHSAVEKTGRYLDAVTVRHIIGVDPQRSGIAVAELLREGLQMSFCERNAQAARADLTRLGTEIRASLEPEELSQEMARDWSASELSQPHPDRRVLGAIYVSCAGRGGPHFGAPSAELQVLKRALGDVPLVGFFAGGEIAHQNLYGYSGVLTVFTG